MIGPVYHGTRADFRHYDRNALGGFSYMPPGIDSSLAGHGLKSGGIFFTPFPCLASRFSIGFDVMMEITGANIRKEYLNAKTTRILKPSDNPKKCIYKQMELLAQAEIDKIDAVGIMDEWDRIVEWVVFKPNVVVSAWAG